ncbi:Meiotically up-regulated protein 86 protein [Ceratocystis pirilliformis]|uniref:Meiotically up-regulated protein 86 protein n=1 Tax=Ceratocystis pirilliformis TaxID=259994 RepID=A0ABR3ZD16_9PEZI
MSHDSIEKGHGPNYHEDRVVVQASQLRPYEHRKFANPAPLGLSAFALTTFVLSCINMRARGVHTNTIIMTLAYAYGGFVQMLAGMWEFAVGNTFGATAFTSYGGFWIAFGILTTPAFKLTNTVDGPYAEDAKDLNSAIGFFLTGWWIFTTLLLLCTLKSTVMFFMLFFTLDIAFLCLAVENYALSEGAVEIGHNLATAGGLFGMLAAFLAWYNALAGLQDSSNSFFKLPVFPMPWSDAAKGISSGH